MKFLELFKVFFKTTKGKIVTIGGGTSVVAIGIAVAVLLQGEGYRSIAVEQLAGSVTVVGTENNGQAYVGEHLYSGDDVTVGDASELTMCMDNDKYVYADSNTHFLLEASAANEDSRIKIFLDAGSELNVLESQLAANETYEVNTPNSTMSVRGTTFRVTVYTAAGGMTYTLTEVTEGTVKARLKTKDGTYNGVEQDFTAGQSALIRGNDVFSEFVTSDLLDTSDLDMDDMDETELLLLAYDELPEGGLDRLIELLEKNDLIEEDTEKEEETEALPTPSVTPEPEASPAVEPDLALDEAEVTPAPTMMDILFDEWVTGTDPETGGYVLKDGTIFDPVYYAQHNPDVVEKYGTDPKALLYHWLTQGRAEKRPPSEKAAKAQEEEFLKFAKMLDESYAEEQRLKQLAEAKAKEEEDSTVSKTTGTSGGSTGSVITPNPLGNNNTYIELNNGAVKSYIDNTGQLVVYTGGSITLPLQISGYSGPEFNSFSQMNWTYSGNGYGGSNGGDFSVTNASGIKMTKYQTAPNQTGQYSVTDTNGNETFYATDTDAMAYANTL